MLVHGLKIATAAGALALGLTFGAFAQDNPGEGSLTNETNKTEESTTSANPSEATSGTATEQITCTDESFATIETQMGTLTDTTRRTAIEQELVVARQHMSNNEGSQCAERLQSVMDMMMAK
jgi:cytoskeletal protein RodZ